MPGVFRWLGTAISLCMLLWVFRHSSLPMMASLLRDLHGSVWLIPLPFAMAQLTETWAWRSAFKETGCSVAYGPLLRVRLACEGIAQTIPGGMVIAESIKPTLLMTQCGLTASNAVCGAAARKLLLLVSQCGYFALAVVLGLPALLAATNTSRLGHWLPTFVILAWLLLVVCAVGLALVMHRGDVCARILSLLKHVPMRALRVAADRWHAGFVATDGRFVEFCELGARRLARPACLYLMTWAWEAVETALLLTLLGVRFDFGTFCLIEVCASMIRHVAFVAPAGLGIQDLSYAVLLQVFGVPDWLGVAATFTLLKRSKELLWSLVGFSLLASMQRSIRPRRDSSRPRIIDAGGYASSGAQA